MRAYYGSKISKNMTFTPEGFLVCLNVPIARVGWYDYLEEEVDSSKKGSKQIVKVFRDPDEVFDPGAMASFEGKPVTEGHPPDEKGVTPENFKQFGKGTATNIRRGSGEDIDLLLADLVIHDKQLIQDIQSGKREVSAGYDVSYVPNGDGTYSQKDIVGNHVAVLDNGRAGDRVKIRDSQPTKEDKGMSIKIKLPNRRKPSSVTSVLAAIGLKQFAQDAEPDEIVDAVDAMAEEKGAANDENVPGNQIPPQNPSPAKDDGQQDPAVAALEAKVDKLTELVTQLVAQKQQDASPEDAIDAAIAELQGKSTDENSEEESHIIDPSLVTDEGPGPVSDPDERPENPLTADSGYKIAALRAMKPVIATISDPVERKKVADAAIASIKGKPPVNTYAVINQSRKKTKDAKPVQQEEPDISDLGRQIAEQWNPHFKNKKKN